MLRQKKTKTKNKTKEKDNVGTLLQKQMVNMKKK